MFVFMMFMIVTALTSTQILCNHLLNQEEAYYSSYDDQICQHLLRIMTMSTTPIFSMMMMIVMIVTSTAAATEMGECVEEDVPEEASNCEGDKVVDYGVSQGGSREEEQIQQVDEEDGDDRDKKG